MVFIPFPIPKTQKENCERWIRVCGKKYFTVEETYICSKHFVGSKGPTPEHPDPLPALATSFKRSILLSKRKRRSHLKRHTTHKPSRQEKLAFDRDEDEDNNTECDLPEYSVHTDPVIQTNKSTVGGRREVEVDTQMTSVIP